MNTTQLLSTLLQEATQPSARKSALHLTALVDMALLTEDQRQHLHSQLGAQLIPLLIEPEYQALQALGAMLIQAEDARQLLEQLQGYSHQGVISGWITSILPAQALAAHLRQATFAYRDAADRYLLRYYAPNTLPVLLQAASADWTAWFLSPVASWWFDASTAQMQAWQRITGLARQPGAAPQLQLTETLWQALAGDPLPYQLLTALEQQYPQAFASECKGVRLAQVEHLLEQARQQGLTQQEDWLTYMQVCLLRSAPQLKRDNDWLTAVAAAADGQGTLARLYRPLAQQG